MTVHRFWYCTAKSDWLDINHLSEQEMKPCLQFRVHNMVPHLLLEIMK